MTIRLALDPKGPWTQFLHMECTRHHQLCNKTKIQGRFWCSKPIWGHHTQSSTKSGDLLWGLQSSLLHLTKDQDKRSGNGLLFRPKGKGLQACKDRNLIWLDKVRSFFVTLKNNEGLCINFISTIVTVFSCSTRCSSLPSIGNQSDTVHRRCQSAE